MRSLTNRRPIVLAPERARRIKTKRLLAGKLMFLGVRAIRFLKRFLVLVSAKTRQARG